MRMSFDWSFVPTDPLRHGPRHQRENNAVTIIKLAARIKMSVKKLAVSSIAAVDSRQGRKLDANRLSAPWKCRFNPYAQGTCRGR